MMKMFFIAFIFLPLSAFATGVSGRLTVTPILGIERVQKFKPTTSMKTRNVYGVGAVYRFPISALEVEYTNANDTSDDTATSTSYKDEEKKLRLGLRGNFALGSMFSFHLRGGAQGRENTETKTVNSTSVTKSSSSKVQPYVGTGIEMHAYKLASISLNVVATYTPTDDPNLSDFEIQPAFGINVKF